MVVEECSRRVFTDTEYALAGARVVATLPACPLVVCVKDRPAVEPIGAYTRETWFAGFVSPSLCGWFILCGGHLS